MLQDEKLEEKAGDKDNEAKGDVKETKDTEMVTEVLKLHTMSSQRRPNIPQCVFKWL